MLFAFFVRCAFFVANTIFVRKTFGKPLENLHVITFPFITGPAAPSISPSRLMAASWTLRSSTLSPSKPIFSLPRAIWHRQGLTATASGRTPMQTLYPLCSIALQRLPGEEEQEVDSSSADVGQSFEYELCVQQVRNALVESAWCGTCTSP